MTLLKGNNLELLRTLPSNCIDSVVTDPPYGLSFMNKKWDHDVPSIAFWKEVYRVLKPGGHVLSFGGTRTYHRMAVNIEDAGFEIRDQIMWIYGSGFPKSYNIGKAVEKLTGSSEYQGWGTCLKPANEPICVARKPLSEKNNATNVLKWCTGGVNIDACKIAVDLSGINNLKDDELDFESDEVNGRFPANIIFDEFAAQILDAQTGMLKSGKVEAHHKRGKTLGEYQGNCYGKYNNQDQFLRPTYGDEGGASRFFYVAKTNKKERNLALNKDNNHPTVKPINLMTYLCRLVTPFGGTVLDPFMGSGSTGIAALLEGFDFMGMELDNDYFTIAEDRIDSYEEYRSVLKRQYEPMAIAA